MPTPVQSLFAAGCTSATDAVVTEFDAEKVYVSVVGSSIWSRVVVTARSAFVRIEGRVDDEFTDDGTNGDEVDEPDDENDEAEEADDEADDEAEAVCELDVVEEGEVEVVGDVDEDE